MSIFSSMAGSITMGAYESYIEKLAKQKSDSRKATEAGIAGIVGGSMAAPLGQLYEARKQFKVKGNRLTREKYDQAIKSVTSGKIFKRRPSSGKSILPRPKINVENLEIAKRLVKFAPDAHFKKKGTTRKEVKEAIGLAQDFLKNKTRSGRIAGAGGALIGGGIVGALNMEKSAYGIPVKGAVGPRRYGVAQVNKRMPPPAGEPAGKPIVSKKSMRTFLSKKNKALPGNINDIGKLT